MFLQGVQTLSVKSKLAISELWNGDVLMIKGSNWPIVVRNFVVLGHDAQIFLIHIEFTKLRNCYFTNKLKKYENQNSK